MGQADLLGSRSARAVQGDLVSEKEKKKPPPNNTVLVIWFEYSQMEPDCNHVTFPIIVQNGEEEVRVWQSFIVSCHSRLTAIPFAILHFCQLGWFSRLNLPLWLNFSPRSYYRLNIVRHRSMRLVHACDGHLINSDCFLYKSTIHQLGLYLGFKEILSCRERNELFIRSPRSQSWNAENIIVFNYKCIVPWRLRGNTPVGRFSICFEEFMPDINQLYTHFNLLASV